MDHKEQIIAYNGQLSADVIDNLINEFRDQTESLCLKKAFFKRILSIMIESLENVYKYYQKCKDNQTPLNTNHYPKFSLERNNDGFHIKTGNVIYKEDVEPVKKKIDSLNKMDKDSLKELYINTIKNGHFSEQGGAGLGLIKIARASRNKIDYDFDDINNDFSYYTLHSKILDDPEK